MKINDYNMFEHFLAINERDVYVSYTGNYEMDELQHLHYSIEILFTEEGQADYMINGARYRCEKNSVLIIGSMDPHHRIIEHPPFIRYGLTISPDYVHGQVWDTELLKILRTPSREEFGCFTDIPDEAFGVLKELLHVLKRETEKPALLSEVMVGCTLKILLVELCRLVKQEGATVEYSGMFETMTNIRQYIYQNYREEITLADLSERFYMHPSTISKEFKNCFDMTFNHYLNSVRVMNAVKLLENTDKNVTEIAHLAGYDSVNTFLRRFKGFMDVSPLQYRKRFQNYSKHFDDIDKPMGQLQEDQDALNKKR